MMKLWSRLCFLVLAFSSLSRGENETAAPPAPTPPPWSPSEETQNEPARATLPTASPQSNTLANARDLPSAGLPVTDAAGLTQTQNSSDNVIGTRKEAEEQTSTSAIKTEAVTEGVDVKRTMVSTATAGTSFTPVTPGHASTAGYVFLFMILLMIIVLCVILYFLRRASRSYSFDLHRPVPANHHNEPIGNFEPVYLDDLDRPAPKDDMTTNAPSPPPVSNGTTLQSEELISSGESDTEKAPQNQPDASGLETLPPSGNTSPSLGHVAADNTSCPFSSTNLLLDAVGEEQQNENNNNNPSVSSSEPFVEINLDEPAWCDELLTSSEASSSVLPFSPFSLSSIST
ncbi:uncharacterized protein LOC117962048 [Etheostoma cragini]|uniref:uncharacterized protein LOC117962048 n=1 Tax=Etheostoma cragini TaxID=417921 RepID=UPI00155E4D48|nr:uncharacterized protein LOC117962048 [Etheostoma cragini]